MLNALQPQEQRRAMRHEDDVEGALFVKHGKNYKSTKRSIHQRVITGAILAIRKDLILHASIVKGYLIHMLEKTRT